MHLNGLLEFIDINRDGFRKALKKHDKVLGGLPHHARLQPECPRWTRSSPTRTARTCRRAPCAECGLAVRSLAACLSRAHAGSWQSLWHLWHAARRRNHPLTLQPRGGPVLGKHLRVCAVLGRRAGLQRAASPAAARAISGGRAAAGGANAGGEPVRGRVLQRQHRACGARAAAAAARPRRVRAVRDRRPGRAGPMAPAPRRGSVTAYSYMPCSGCRTGSGFGVQGLGSGFQNPTRSPRAPQEHGVEGDGGEGAAHRHGARGPRRHGDLGAPPAPAGGAAGVRRGVRNGAGCALAPRPAPSRAAPRTSCKAPGAVPQGLRAALPCLFSCWRRQAALLCMLAAARS